jgi:hypothetical protein
MAPLAASAEVFRVFPTRLPLALAAAMLTLALAAPARADVAATAGYVLTLGGMNVATAEVKLSDAGGHYDVALDAHVTGLAGLVASGTAKAESSGTDTATGLRSENFHLLTRANGEDFDIKAQFAGGNVDAFIITPPIVNNINRVPIERSQLTGVGDMVAAFILKGAALDAGLCNRKMRIFTGIERFDLTMSDVGPDKATSLRTAYQGPVEQCRIKYTPISGHFTTSESTAYLAQSDRIFIWYAPLGASGYYIPYRVLLATSVGDLSMVLTSLKD